MADFEEREGFLIHMPPNELREVNTVWVWLSVDETPDGEREAQCAIAGLPLVLVNERILNKIEPAMREMARLGNKKLRLIKIIGKREVVKEIIP